MARPKAAQPIAASAVFIKSRENFLSILQQEAQQPVRPAIVSGGGLERRVPVARLIFVSGQTTLAVILNNRRADGVPGFEIRDL